MSLKNIVKETMFRLGYRVEKMSAANRNFPILRPIDSNGIEILEDQEFQASCKMLRDTTLLDTERLANLWMLCRLTNPAGAIAEIGTYRGGGALHLSNCCPNRLVVVCDPFDSLRCFEEIDPELDKVFRYGQFTGHSLEHVTKLLDGRNCLVYPGYFPKSVTGLDFPKLSFVHLDTDVYKATKESLVFLLTQNVMLDGALIVVDDFNRKAAGVNRAIEEIIDEVEGTRAFPLFPGQALIVPKPWGVAAC